MKRLFDIVVASSILLVFSPVICLLTLLVFITSGSPVFFLQQRPGLNGKPFWFYKFRTMNNRKDAAGELLPDKERITSFGSFLRKSSLDELPSFFNVLKGDMSLVGPRPLLMEYLPLYNETQMRRHEVKPGITGLAQVNGRNDISWEKRFQLDVQYVEQQSFLLDLKILSMTFFTVLFRKGINAEGHATMPKFEGSSKTDSSD